VLGGNAVPKVWELVGDGEVALYSYGMGERLPARSALRVLGEEMGCLSGTVGVREPTVGNGNGGSGELQRASVCCDYIPLVVAVASAERSRSRAVQQNWKKRTLKTHRRVSQESGSSPIRKGLRANKVQAIDFIWVLLR
jgi:hypothetical protein